MQGKQPKRAAVVPFWSLAIALCIGGAATMTTTTIVLGQQQQPPDQAAAMTLSRLRSLGQALQMYASDYKGFLPADFSLLKKMLPDDQITAATRDLIYVIPPGSRINRLRPAGQYPAAMNKPAMDQPLYILFVDGHVQGYVPISAGTVLTPAAAATRASTGMPPGVRPYATRAEPGADEDDANTPPPTTVPNDPTPALIGAWRTDAGPYVDATYQFNTDNTFTLTFVQGQQSQLRGQPIGRASGTWKLDGAGRTIVMTNTQSDTNFTQVGEEERADIAGLDEHALVLSTTDRKGKPEQIVLRKAIAFQKGKRDNEKIVGTWTSQGAMTLVLADSGVAILGPWKGEWSQRGQKLTLTLSMNAPQLPAAAGYHATSRPSPGYQNVTFSIDVLNDTTLAITGQLGGTQPQTMTLLRVK
jgi:hypothetical protein